MSFGSKQLDRAYDNWRTQTPEEYFGVKQCKKCKEWHYEEEECGEE